MKFDFNEQLKKSIKFYKENGYVIFKNIVNQKIIKKINKDLENIINQQYKKNFNTDSLNTDQKLIRLANKNDQFRERIYNIIQNLPSNKELCLNRNFYKICKLLKLKNPIVKSNQIRMDLPFQEKFLIPPHQEIKGTKSNNMIFFITALKKTTKKMGSISIYPKTFKLGPLMPDINKNLRYQYVNKKYYSKIRKREFEMNMGETIFLNMYTIHGSNKNTAKDKIRWSSIMRFEDFANMPYLDLDDSYLQFDLKG